MAPPLRVVWPLRRVRSWSRRVTPRSTSSRRSMPEPSMTLTPPRSHQGQLAGSQVEVAVEVQVLVEDLALLAQRRRQGQGIGSGGQQDAVLATQAVGGLDRIAQEQSASQRPLKTSSVRVTWKSRAAARVGSASRRRASARWPGAAGSGGTWRVPFGDSRSLAMAAVALSATASAWPASASCHPGGHGKWTGQRGAGSRPFIRPLPSHHHSSASAAEAGIRLSPA